jgi:hypothetical protein
LLSGHVADDGIVERAISKVNDFDPG